MIRSVNRTLDILQCVADGKGKPVSVSVIAEKTGLNKATICHITETLQERGYLLQITRFSGYVLGIYAYNLTRYNAYHHDLISNSEPVLNWIQKKTGYNALLANLINGEKFILKYVDNPGNELSSRGMIYKGDLYNCATGRAMLSTMNSKELEEIVEKVGLPKEEEWPGIDSFDKLKKELLLIRKEEVTFYAQPVKNYCWEYAVAINGKLGEKFALGLGLLKDEKPTDEEIENIKKVLIRARKEIIRRMNYSDLD